LLCLFWVAIFIVCGAFYFDLIVHRSAGSLGLILSPLDPPLTPERPTQNRIGCKFLQFAFRIWHLAFAFECGSRARHESFIHSLFLLLLLLMMIQVSICIDLHFNCTFSTLYNGLFCSCINWIRSHPNWFNPILSNAMWFDLFMATLHFQV